MNAVDNSLSGKFKELNRIGIALSAEQDTDRLLEMILVGAKDLANADAGTLYMVNEEAKSLRFEIVRTDSLDIAMGGTTGKDIPFPELPLYKEDGSPNLENVAAYAVVKNKSVNIPDAYEAEGFNFAGTRAFDEKTGYRSKSFMTVPLTNHENEIIGVLQLLNAKDHETDEVIPFSEENQQLTESLASQAAVSLTTKRLIDDLKELFESFISTIATAIDDKSKYTGGHCERVPVLSLLIAEAANRTTEGPLADFQLSDDEMYELRIASWLHDCGKVTTPEYVVDKSTKLETIYDRVNTVVTRFQALKHQRELHYAKRKIHALEAGRVGEIPMLDVAMKKEIKALDDDQAFIEQINVGGEFMSDELLERLNKIAAYPFIDHTGEQVPFLNENEVFNLGIRKGTLTDDERETINHHIVATIKMLEKLPFPKVLSNVTEIAGGHHEKMDGTGYPNGLTGEQLSPQARIMAIADVFEALTAKDRPYKDGKTLTQALKILGFMKKDNHIDEDLFTLFIKEKVYLEYGEKYLDPNQIDEVDQSKIPGYEAPA